MKTQTKPNDEIRGCYSSLKFVADVSLILGKRGSGKTFFVINDIYARISDEIEDIFVVSNTNTTDSEYLQITNKIYSTDDIEYIIKYLSDTKRSQVKKLLIIDIQCKDIYNNLIELVTYHTHINLKIIMVNSTSVGIPPHLRCRIKWLLFGNESCTSEIKRNYDLFGRQFINYDNFENHYDIIQGQEFMVLDLANTELKLKIVKAAKQLKLKKITSPEISIQDNKSNEIKEIIGEVNILIDQLVGIRNRLKKLDKN